MVGDWIKMRTDLYRDPKVCLIADILAGESELARHVGNVASNVMRNVMRNVTVGALVSVWGVCRHRGKRVGNDLHLKGATTNVIDDIADVAGFGKAMLSVGWVKEIEKGLVFPHFFEDNNVDPNEEHKLKNAERQRRFRESKRNVTSNVTVTSQSNGREEESREEKSRDKRKEKESLEPENPGSKPAAIVPAEVPVLTYPTVGRGPPEWPLTPSQIAEWQALHPGVDVLAECRKALAWCTANPTKRKTFTGMPRFLVAWLGRAQDAGKGHHASSNGKTKDQQKDDAFARLVQQTLSEP